MLRRLRRRRRFAVFPLHWATQHSRILFACSFHTRTLAGTLTGTLTPLTNTHTVLARPRRFLFFCVAAAEILCLGLLRAVCCRRFCSLAWIFCGAFGALRSWRLDLVDRESFFPISIRSRDHQSPDTIFSIKNIASESRVPARKSHLEYA